MLPKLLEKNIDAMRAQKYISRDSENETKNMLRTLFTAIFIGTKSEDKINQEIDLMYDDLEKVVKRKLKERYKNLAKERQQKYEIRIDENKLCKTIKNDIMNNIKDKFSPILGEGNENDKLINVDLLKLTDFTDSIGTNNSINGYYSDINGKFLNGIVNYLLRSGVLNIKQRFNDFLDDEEFIKYLEDNNLHLLLGSRFVFRNRDFGSKSKFKMISENEIFKTIYTTVLRDGIALKENSVVVCLHDIDVSIHSPGIEEESAIYDEKTGKYYYPVLGEVLIDFDEKELTEFLYNNYKIINITAKITMQVNEKPCGTIFKSNKNINVY